MIKRKSVYVSFVFILVLQLIMVPLQALGAEVDVKAPSWTKPVTYLALGDSLAFGVTSNNEPGEGYADMLAQSWYTTQTLKMSNKGFSMPGYTTSNVLKDIREDITKPVLGIGGNQTASLQQSIADADIITLSAGANDVLPFFKINAETGKPDIKLQELNNAIKKAGMNIHEIVKAISEINPDAHVFVMGYYNSFPYLDVALQPQINQLTVGLNQAIQSGMQGTNAVYVPTSELIAENFQAYLPNPKSIHLSKEGYQVIANAFKEQIDKHYPWFDKDVIAAVPAGDSSAKLQWKPVITEDKIASYIIYNGDQQVGQVAGDVNSYEAMNLQPGKEYTFTIEAVDEAGHTSIVNPSVNVQTDKAELPETPRFSDITGHWAAPYIEVAAANGLVAGYKDGTFRPEKELTRAQAASIVVNVLNVQSKKAAPFHDISHYADTTKADIAAAYEFGIVKGTNGNFRPNEPVTRAQMALMVKRMVEVSKGGAYKPVIQAPYTDMTGYGKEAQQAVSMLHELGLATGDNGKFMPNGVTTRAHAAKILSNVSTLNSAAGM